MPYHIQTPHLEKKIQINEEEKNRYVHDLLLHIHKGYMHVLVDVLLISLFVIIVIKETALQDIISEQSRGSICRY